MGDSIDRQAVIDAIDQIAVEVVEGDGFQYEKWREYFCDMPSVQPTFYGYDIKHLAFVAFIMAKEGVRPEEAVAIFRDIDRLTQIVFNEIKEIQENTLRQALKSWEKEKE